MEVILTFFFSIETLTFFQENMTGFIIERSIMFRDINVFQMTWYCEKHLRTSVSSLIQGLLKNNTHAQTLYQDELIQRLLKTPAPV